MGPRSLLDTADLGAVRAATGWYGVPGPTATALACLLEGGALQHDPDDPAWPDRDRLAIGLEAAPVGLDDVVVWRGRPGDALAVALGVAEASRLDGAVYRVFCLVDPVAAYSGAFWEAAQAAGATGMTTLTAVLVGAPGPPGAGDGLLGTAAALLRAAGWRVDQSADDPVGVLAALDQALSGPRPGAVVVGGRGGMSGGMG